MKANAPYVLAIIGALWVIQLINAACKYRLNILGIYPRRIPGLIGIVCSPLLHGNAKHLFLNSFPLFILGCFVMVYGVPIFWQVTFMVALMTGFAVWVFGRKAMHIGASGIIMGYFGFLLATAYHQHSAIAIVSVVVCLFYLGSLLLSVIPQRGEASWEAHLFGLLSGLVSSYLLSAGFRL